jgi:TonB family protein
LLEGLHPPAAILHSTAETARLATGADGVALAVRTKGLIVCRACSGDPTPDLGTPLDTDAGFSGECLRTDSILVCNDAENDPRVDPDVCRFLGIRSIAAIPLHGPTGVAGILEAFSTRIQAFGQPQIDSLRALAEIAETAYGREVRGLQEAPTRPPKPMRIRMFSDENNEGTEVGGERSIVRRLWFIGTAVVVMLLLAGVWLSAHEPALETSAKEPSGETNRAQPNPALAPTAVAVASPSKPKAGISRSDPSAAAILKNAAHIEVIEDSPPSAVSPRPTPTGIATATVPSDDDAPPSPATDAAETSTESADQVARLAAAPNPLPTLGAPVSQGVMPGVLMHRVTPLYPPQAKSQRLSGTVTLQITIAEDGHIREVKQISGDPLLAAAASDAIRRWRYTPFLLDGKAVQVQKEISVVFKLP